MSTGKATGQRKTGPFSPVSRHRHQPGSGPKQPAPHRPPRSRPRPWRRPVRRPAPCRPAAAALAAERSGGDADQIDGAEAAGQVVGDGNDGARLAVLGNADKVTTPEPRLFLPSSARPFRSFGSTPVTTLPRNFTPAISLRLHRPSRRRRPPPMRELPLGLGQFALQLAALVHQRFDARQHVRGLNLQRWRQASLRARPARRDIHAPHSPVSASMRRTPAPTALSPRMRTRPISPVARDMRAAAKLDRIGLGRPWSRARPAPSTRRAPHRRIFRRTAPSHPRRSRRRRSSAAS